MNGRKSKVLRKLAVARAAQPLDLGYVERKVRYNSVDRHGKPVVKEKLTHQVMYRPLSWRPIHRRLKRAYARSPELRAKFVGL
jgi:hypothetical protein